MHAPWDNQQSGGALFAAAPAMVNTWIGGADMAKPTCSFDGCERPRLAQGLCSKHYQRARAHGEIDVLPPRSSAVRFQEKVTPGRNGCIEWSGSRNEHGYGIQRIDGRAVKAHRVAWEFAHGPIPAGQHVLHRCDNPPCVNPDHLFLGIHVDNMADMVAKGRAAGATGDRHGSRTHPERVRRGSASGRAKLTEADIPVIRVRLAAGESQRSVARSYGVHHITILQIAHGETWRHVR